MLGVVTLILLHGPQLPEGQDLPVPLSVALLISLVLSAVLFGAGHLPAASALVGTLTHLFTYLAL